MTFTKYLCYTGAHGKDNYDILTRVISTSRPLKGHGLYSTTVMA
jgi:hypothetical protein